MVGEEVIIFLFFPSSFLSQTALLPKPDPYSQVVRRAHLVWLPNSIPCSPYLQLPGSRMRESRENKKAQIKQNKTKQLRERSWSSLHVNNGRHLEVILNTLSEIPVIPTAFVVYRRKIIHLLSCGLETCRSSQPMTKTKTGNFLPLLPPKSFLEQ